MRCFGMLGGGALFALLLFGCAGPSEQVEQVPLPTRARFELVSGMLGVRCGSLDCHGQVGRSLRVYSQTGLRLDPRETPSLDAGSTSEAEASDNYRAAVALEPGLLGAVVSEHGENPARLTLVRKARGSEHHKGGAAAAEGSAADRCLVSWLASDVDAAACLEGATVTRPSPSP